MDEPMQGMEGHVLPTYRPADPVFVSGRGARLADGEGREYLDLLSGIGVTALGHAHPRWVAAVSDQAGRLAHVSNLLRHPYTHRVARRLARLSGLSGVFFSNSGSEANECALKLARKHQALAGRGQRHSFVALEGGFHGRTFGSLSVTAREAYRAPFGPALAATFVPPGDLAALESALQGGTQESPAALILEPVQGEGGLTALDAPYLREARRLCDQTGTLLISDEVQCGAGRTGTFLAIADAGVVPDLATLAKPLGGGLPVGATLVREDLAEVLQPGDHGSTFGGGPLVLAAVEVFLEELEGGLAQAVRVRGAQLTEGLEALAQRHREAGVEARGRGLMGGLSVPGRATDLQRALFERRLIAGTAGGDVLRLLPPFVIDAEELSRALELIGETLSQILSVQPASHP